MPCPTLASSARTVLSAVSLFCLSISPAAAGNVEISLVAADQAEKQEQPRPLVSHVVEFRNSPDGGLIATQWISGVRLGRQVLFPVKNLKGDIPQAPGIGNVAAQPKPGGDLLDDVDDLLKELKPAKKTEIPPRPVEQIDPLYRDVTFLSDGRKIEIHRTRLSQQTAAVSGTDELWPTALRVQGTQAKLAVPCYPVEITARVAGQLGRTTTFLPSLTCEGVDLLADCLFEHSPDLPLGHLANPQAAANLNDWLAATRGGQREFLQLTIYLPANAADKPYRLNGTNFSVKSAGVKLSGGSKSSKQVLEQTAPFKLQLVLTPAEPAAAPISVPVLSELPASWKTDFSGPIALRGRALAVPLRDENNRPQVLQIPMPQSDEETQYHNIALLGGGSDGVEVWGRWLQFPAQHAAETFTLNVSQANMAGVLNVPEEFTATLSPWGDAAAEPQQQLTFKLRARQSFAATLNDIPAGLYALRLDLQPQTDQAVPVVIAPPGTQGSLSLLTYHNRSDYLRGELIPVQLVRRALDALQETNVSLSLKRIDSKSPEEPLSLGKIKLSGDRQVQGTFVSLDTALLAPGQYRVQAAAENLVTHPLEFTVHPDRELTSFDRFAWMTASFSGPVRAEGETLVDCVLGQRPSQFLAPSEEANLAGQRALPESLRSMLASDPLFPPAEATATYDDETEQEMAIGMRLGVRYAPDYGWGLNGQEAAWNPKHSLPADLDRIRRLCSLVTQRHRDFANFGGLHLNWYPTYGGYWENHPPTDGHVGVRKQRLQAELAQLGQNNSLLSAAVTEDQLALASLRHKYRVGALPRAYEAWLAPTRALHRGLNDTGRFGPGEKYLSMLPLSWFDQHQYYPSVYFSTLPAAGVHAYTDYGFSAYQPLWGIDYWGAGRGNADTWVTTMSNGPDIMIRHALLSAGRGADGIDIKGLDPHASRVIAEFLAAYGPMFRQLEVESDVAIVTSLRQQIAHGKLVGRWMGYTGGDYFELYKNLWYARRPPAMLLEEDITPDRLRQYKGVFLVQQKEPLPTEAMAALRDYAAAGGQVFKDEHTAPDYPGQVYTLAKADQPEQPWQPEKYVQTRDRIFVGTQAGYEAVAVSLAELLAKLDPPRIETPSHETLLASLRGRQLSVAFAVNDTHTPPGIYHPWNFWSATILASESQLKFDRPYIVYDLLDGGRQLQAMPDGEGRFSLPVQFDRLAGKAYVFCESPLEKLQIKVEPPRADGTSQLSLVVQDAAGQPIQDPVPCEIRVLDQQQRVVERLYRALTPRGALQLQLPTAQAANYTVEVQELISGLAATAKVSVPKAPQLMSLAHQVHMPRESEVRWFLEQRRTPTPAQRRKATHADGTFDPLIPVELPGDEELQPSAEKQFVILLDPAQVAEQPEIASLAESLSAKLNAAGRPARVWMPDPLELVELPQRWQMTERDQALLASARRGEVLLVAKPLTTKHGTVNNRANQPDFVHPESGYGEPGPRHRIYDEVILLGLPQNNRYLADLHASVGERASANYPAPGCALVQMITDAFCPRYNALSIQGADVSALSAAIDQVLTQVRNYGTDGKPAEVSDTATSQRQPDPLPTNTAPVVSSERRELPNPWRTQLGLAVHPHSFTKDGGLLVSAGTQAANYFRFDKDGNLERKWLGKYGLRMSGQDGAAWIENWYGVPGFVDMIIRADRDAEPQWMMPAARFSGSFSSWRHPGQRHLIDPASDDLFAGGQQQVMRIDPDGNVLWRYDDLPSVQDVDSFRFRRDMMLHDVSQDGKYLLVAAYGIEPYARTVARFVRPAVLLLDAVTGKVLWEKAGVLINHSVCQFAGDGILLADATPEHRRLLFCSLQGKELWSLDRPEGTSAAALSPAGQWLALREEVPRDRSQQVLGEAGGFIAFNLADRTSRKFPLLGRLLSWAVVPDSGNLLMSGDDGVLRCFAPDASLLWQLDTGGEAKAVVDANSGRIAVGTPRGELLLLTPDGQVQQRVDLMPHNLVKDRQAYVAAYTARPDVPMREPRPAMPPTINERSGDLVKFSENLLPSVSDAVRQIDPKGLMLGSPNLEKGQTYVLSLVGQMQGLPADAAQGLFAVTFQQPGGKETQRFELPLALTWAERTLAFRPKESGTYAIRLEYVPQGEDATAKFGQGELHPQLRSAALMRLTFPSPNVLAQKIPDAPDPLAGPKPTGGLGGLLDVSEKVTPPSIRYVLPNDVDLAARARGAAPFNHTVEFTVPFDGKLAEQETSWLRKPANGSTHARLELSFKQPVTLAALALYEDPVAASRYSGTFGVFLHDPQSGQWSQAGAVVQNQNAFNLFTFKPTEVDKVVYLWLDSPDGHVRVAELEGYREESLLLP